VPTNPFTEPLTSCPRCHADRGEAAACPGCGIPWTWLQVNASCDVCGDGEVASVARDAFFYEEARVLVAEVGATMHYRCSEHHRAVVETRCVSKEAAVAAARAA